MPSKIYLVVVAALYIFLALWCTAQPETTSTKVGFELKGGSGQSEFMTVYGGLEFGMAIVFLLAIWPLGNVYFGVLACTVIHASLVVFRTISFFRFSDFDSFTYRLAAGEWVFMLIGIVLLILHSKQASLLD